MPPVCMLVMTQKKPPHRPPPAQSHAAPNNQMDTGATHPMCCHFHHPSIHLQMPVLHLHSHHQSGCHVPPGAWVALGFGLGVVHIAHTFYILVCALPMVLLSLVMVALVCGEVERMWMYMERWQLPTFMIGSHREASKGKEWGEYSNASAGTCRGRSCLVLDRTCVGNLLDSFISFVSWLQV